MDLSLDHFYFNPLLQDPYSEFSLSHSSDIDLSPSLSPSMEFAFEQLPSQDFDPEWSGSFVSNSVTNNQVLPKDVVIQDMAPFTPSNTFLQPFEPLLVTPPTPEASVSGGLTKPRGKRRKLDSEKEVATTPPPTPPCLASGVEPRLDLSRDELLTLTSAQFESLISQVRANRDLTPHEKREIKKQRRLIKNRESAHASRQRKKDYVQELEKKIADLNYENEKLTNALNVSQNENLLLRSENHYYKGKMQSIPGILHRGATFVSEHLQPALAQSQEQLQLQKQIQFLQAQQQQFQNLQPQLQQLHTQAARLSAQKQRASSSGKAGVVLMVLLFSFGIMFGNLGFPGSKQLALESSVPEVIPSRIYQREDFKPVSHVAAENYFPENQIQSGAIKERLRRRMNSETPSPFASFEDTEIHEVVKPEVGMNQDFLSVHHPQLLNLDPSFFKANTTYLVCQNMYKLQPPQLWNGNQADASESQLSFIIPPSSLDSDAQQEGLLVVTCEVTNVAMVEGRA